MTDTNLVEPEAEARKFAVYDETHLRFLDGVFDSRTAANEAKKSGPEGHKLTVREV